MTSKGKRLTGVIVLLGLLVLVATGYVGKDRAVEQWYLWKLNSDNEEDRKLAAGKLGEMRSVKAIPRLMELFRQRPLEEFDRSTLIDPRTQRRRVAYTYSGEALLAMGLPAFPYLSELLRDENVLVRRFARMALDAVGTDALPVLIAGLTVADEGTRRGAVAGLEDTIVTVGSDILDAAEGSKPPSSVIPALINALQDPRADVRWASAWAVGHIGSAAKASMPALKDAHKDRYPFVRHAAAEIEGPR